MMINRFTATANIYGGTAPDAAVQACNITLTVIRIRNCKVLYKQRVASDSTVAEM